MKNILSLKFWLPVVLYFGFVSLLSASPASIERPSFFDWPHFDKVFHFILYSSFGILLVRLLTKGLRLDWHGVLTHLLFLVVVAVCAGVDEWHQSFYEHRDVNIWDGLADVTGAWFGASIYQSLLHYRVADKVIRERTAFAFLFTLICYFVLAVLNGIDYKVWFFGTEPAFLFKVLSFVEFFLFGIVVSRFVRFYKRLSPDWFRNLILLDIVFMSVFLIFMAFLEKGFALPQILLVVPALIGGNIFYGLVLRKLDRDQIFSLGESL